MPKARQLFCGTKVAQFLPSASILPPLTHTYTYPKHTEHFNSHISSILRKLMYW